MYGVSESWRTGGFQEGRVCSHPTAEGRMSSLVAFLAMLISWRCHFYGPGGKESRVYRGRED